jgi:hypothetical protein
MSNPRVEEDTYDPHIVPAETAARKEREGENYKQIPEDNESDINTTGGYTVDREGLVDNFAIEPEMYYEVPGDLAEKEEAERVERAKELADINDNDESGKLTLERDERGKGSGII